MSNYRLTNDSSPDALDSEDETLRAGNHKSSGSHSNEWLVNVADDVVVPMVTTEVIEALRAGRLTNRSLVWRIGMHDWSPLAEVPQLRLAAGPTALPPAASTPGPIVVKKPAKPNAEQRRRNTLPMGFPAVRDAASIQQPAGLSAPPPSPPLGAPRSPQSKREDSSDALAVYERAAPSLTFADSVRAEWQGTGRLVNQAAPRTAPEPAPRRLTPVPPVAARLPARVVRSAPSNTLSPTTAEAEVAAPARGVSTWGDRSVVLASELRAVKKTSKRVAVWAAAASALVASAFTFWASRAPVPSFRPAQMSAPAAALAPASPEPTAIKTETAPPAATAPPGAASGPSVTPPATATAVSVSAPKPLAVVQPARVVRRPKPAKPAAEPSAPTTDNPYADDAPTESKATDAKATDAPANDAKPATAATLAAAIATAVQGSAAPPPAAPSPGSASAATPGF